MRSKKILVWAFFTILLALSCNKDQQIYPPDYFIVGSENNMMITKDTITLVPEVAFPKVVNFDIDHDGLEDLTIKATYNTFMGGSAGYRQFSFSTVNPEFEIFGYLNQDTIWHSLSHDTIIHMTSVIFETRNIYSCIHSSPNQTIHKIYPDIVKPNYYLFGDTVNTTLQTYNCNITLYREKYNYSESYSSHDTIWGTITYILDDCTLLPKEIELYLCFVKKTKKGLRYPGWLKLYLANNIKYLRITEQAIARR